MLATAVSPADESTTDAPPVPFVGNPRPLYPSRLAHEGVSGTVVARFVIDSLGRPDPQSRDVLESPDLSFADAVRTVLPQLMPSIHGIRSIARRRAMQRIS